MSIEICVTHVEYSIRDNKPIIHIFGRDSDKESHMVEINNFRPYFYSPIDVIEKYDNLDTIEGIEIDTSHVYTAIKGEKLNKVYFENPYDLKDNKDLFDAFEADIHYTSRFLIDKNIVSGICIENKECNADDIKTIDMRVSPRFMILDIECDTDGVFPVAEENPIICLTCYDSYDDYYESFYYKSPHGKMFNKKYAIEQNETPLCFDKSHHKVNTYYDEISMLVGFCQYLHNKNPDIMTGWNYNGFDFPYIIKRMITLGMNPSILGRMPSYIDPNKQKYLRLKGRSSFDLLNGYKNLQTSNKDSYRLDAIGEEELGEHKVRYNGTMRNLWDNEPEKLLEYNFQDVKLCVGINAKNDIIGFHNMLAQYVGTSIENTTVSMILVDIFLLRFAYGQYILPTKKYHFGKEFEGAVVLEPSLGLREDVIVLDLKSLYPMIMMTINASPETKVESCDINKYNPEDIIRAPNGVCYKRNPDGITRKLMTMLLEERDSTKAKRNEYSFDSNEYHLLDLEQNALKVIMNTYYGVSGNPAFRLADSEFGASVTATGRSLIAHCKKILEELGYNVVYGDTDSVMVELNLNGNLDEVLKVGKKLQDILNASFDEFAKNTLNTDKHFFSIKFEKYYRRFLQTGKKKRYAGHLVWKEGVEFDKIDITGFEAKRSDVAIAVRTIQAELLKSLITGIPMSTIKSTMREFVKKYKNGGFSLDEVGIPQGISKPLEDYENKDAHVKGCLYSNQYLKTNYGAGSKPKRIYISFVRENYPQTDVICFEYSDEVPSEFCVDWDKMFDSSVRNPIASIIEPIGWNFNDIDPSVTTLGDYFADIFKDQFDETQVRQLKPKKQSKKRKK